MQYCTRTNFGLSMYMHIENVYAHSSNGGLLKKVFRRVIGADLYVRPNTCRVSINKIVRHPIYGNHYLLAQAVGVVQNGT